MLIGVLRGSCCEDETNLDGEPRERVNQLCLLSSLPPIH